MHVHETDTDMGCEQVLVMGTLPQNLTKIQWVNNSELLYYEFYYCKIKNCIYYELLYYLKTKNCY